ncbi:diguanylate cyclase/phosphodiesterase [Caballeronia temeraria]|uniref:Diguanylate cyclase/phosphodiesterase n=1 Tax=Caballeronia temeraria TaxID=1777137 RepID=A0A158A0R8_9BURK|nr:EAL domain-containing protein [Caballeronia temeraria]SAK51319.1 diguanylate cyclase/phosphodiesterase [Caballeronia temeraria]
MSLCLRVAETRPRSIRQLIESNALTAVFQPIVRFADGEIIGYEGLIRGPAGTALEAPAALFEQAACEQQGIALEQAAARTCIAAFARLARMGLLFINFSAAAIESGIAQGETPGDLAREAGLDVQRLVVELTEQSVIVDADRFGASVRALRASGLQFALDDVSTVAAVAKRWAKEHASGFAVLDLAEFDPGVI